MSVAELIATQDLLDEAEYLYPNETCHIEYIYYEEERVWYANLYGSSEWTFVQGSGYTKEAAQQSLAYTFYEMDRDF